jgi:hypothetical protein
VCWPEALQAAAGWIYSWLHSARASLMHSSLTACSADVRLLLTALSSCCGAQRTGTMLTSIGPRALRAKHV